MNGADILCDTLLASGIDTCIANPGTSEMHFVAALDRKPAMRCVLGLSESVVTGIADGYARMAERPAATLLHLGPGLANGLANLHNARRARTPMVTVVGDHASHHLPFDAPLTTDIETLARPMSDWVRRVNGPADVSRAAAEAVSVAMTPPGQVATLILPADAAWSEAPGEIVQAERPPAWRPDEGRIREAATALRGDAGRAVILLSGRALREDTLRVAGRIAKATGARLLAQQSNARMARGAGRVPIERVPYAVDRALALFAQTSTVVLVGAKAPVSFFAYPGKPSSMLPEHCRVLEMARPGDDLAAALDALADAVGAPADGEPAVNARSAPDLPDGPLDSLAIARAIAALAPEGAILCDESVSSGRDFFPVSHGAAPHDFLQLTGGAIGLGMPLATGAAIACPDRKVIGMQADGSGLFTVQALWTQAREALDVVTLVFANRGYAILHGELKAVGAGEPGRNARRMLDLDEPPIDWVHLAMGLGVEGARATDAKQLCDLLRAAVGRRGPFLIEMKL
ncbi:MAG: acetolactate synthase large subunit [Burkholderiaceae bacterium]|nr:acetolactate synthase large subunit [Burkholderiaceae bacterium]